MNAERRPAGNRGGAQMTAGEVVEDSVTPLAGTLSLFEPVSRHARDGWRLDPSVIARDEAIAVVEDAADDWSRKVIDQAIRSIGQTSGHVTSNDLRDVLPAVPPNLLGPRLLAAAKRGLLVEDGTVRATHVAGHARRIVNWRWVG